MPQTDATPHLDQRIFKALAHPLRPRILHVLIDRVASPKEIAQELGESLGTVSYHVKILRDYDCIELVETKPRRGAVEHFYRAVVRPLIDDRQWPELPVEMRRHLLGTTLEVLMTDARAGAAGGAFDQDGVHLSRTVLDLDMRGRRDLLKLLERTLERAIDIQVKSVERRARSPESASVPVLLGMLAFERMPAPADGPRRRPSRRKTAT